MTAKSTRVTIVEDGLADVFERLKDLPDTTEVRELRGRAAYYQRVVEAWSAAPPTPEQRASMMRLVLELNVAIMKAGQSSG